MHYATDAFCDSVKLNLLFRQADGASSTAIWAAGGYALQHSPFGEVPR